MKGKNRKLNPYFVRVYLKGIAMGMADIVPGVSGGTIAFISGIYDRLLSALSQLHPRLLKQGFQQGWMSVWVKLDGGFLLSLFAGILTSIFTVAGLVSYLLADQALFLYSFFFGLIVASGWLIGKQLKLYNLPTWLSFISGITVALAIASLSSFNLPINALTLFFCGMLAICAMILPGISGSLILLLLGVYDRVLFAVSHFDLEILVVFASGCACGLIAFSRALHWLLRHYRNGVLSFLSGLMLGSLVKVWPWKLDSQAVLPFHYEIVSGHPANLVLALVLMLIGAAVVVILDSYRRHLLTVEIND